MTRVVVLLATALALGAAAQRSVAADEQRHVELMPKEEVMEMHANFARARELQTVPVGTVLNVGACVRARAQTPCPPVTPLRGAGKRGADARLTTVALLSPLCPWCRCHHAGRVHICQRHHVQLLVVRCGLDAALHLPTG